MTTDRYLGLFFICFGALLYAVIIPWQVETVDYGWLKPRTLPRILAIGLGLCGVAMLVWPPHDARPSLSPWIRSSLFAGLLVVALVLMGGLGFVWVAPVLALAVMLLAGERRLFWLVAGAVAMPAAIWFCVVILLERPLP